MYNKKIFPNALRVVTKELDSTKAVTVLILVGAGSRYETREINGIAHFLEHMFFKGAKKYKNTKEVSEAIDSVGGEFNAFTGKEYVGYYVKVADKYVKIAMDVLSDMMINSRFDQAEIDRERGVILEEYNMYEDTPMHKIGWDFEELVYGDQPMGWDQIGTKDVIGSLMQKDFFDYKNKLYSPDNTVISIAGHVKSADSWRLVGDFFKFKDGKKAYPALPVIMPKCKKFIHLRNKKTEQAHIMLGFPGYSERHPDHFALKLLTIVLGGNMSSRMFLSVRERKGLAYYISCSSDDYTDTGTVSVNAGVALEGIDKALVAILDEYKRVCDEEVPEVELKKAKEFLKGKLILKLEDCEEYAHLLGKYEVLYGEEMSLKKMAEKIDKVSASDLLRVARDLFISDKLYLAVIGPYNDEERFRKLLKF